MFSPRMPLLETTTAKPLRSRPAGSPSRRLELSRAPSDSSEPANGWHGQRRPRDPGTSPRSPTSSTARSSMDTRTGLGALPPRAGPWVSRRRERTYTRSTFLRRERGANTLGLTLSRAASHLIRSESTRVPSSGSGTGLACRPPGSAAGRAPARRRAPVCLAAAARARRSCVGLNRRGRDRVDLASLGRPSRKRARLCVPSACERPRNGGSGLLRAIVPVTFPRIPTKPTGKPTWGCVIGSESPTALLRRRARMRVPSACERPQSGGGGPRPRPVPPIFHGTRREPTG